MTLNEILFLLTVFFSQTVQTINGFGGTMLSMPASMRLLGMVEAKTILNLVALLLGIFILIKVHKDINKKESLKISIFMGIGIIIGLYLFYIIPSEILMKIYGIFVIVVAIKGLFSKREIKFSSFALFLILLSSGIIHGLFLSGGALVVLYAISVLKDKTIIRATLAPVWILLNTSVLVQDIARGNINIEVVKLFLYTIPILVVCVFLGNYLHYKLNQRTFIKLTYMLIVISGSLLIF